MNFDDQEQVANHSKALVSQGGHRINAMKSGLSFRVRPVDQASVLISALVYALAAWALLPQQSVWFLALAAVPVSLAGWFLGPWAGAIAGGLALLFHWIRLSLVPELNLMPALDPVILGFLGLTLLGYLIGLLRRQSRQAAELAALLAESQALAAFSQVDDVLQYCAAQLARYGEVQGCTLYRWDPAADALEPWRRFPASASKNGKVQDRPLPLDDLPSARQVLKEAAPRQVPVKGPTSNSFEVARIKQAGLKSVLLLPLSAHQEVFGLARVAALEAEVHFPPRQIHFLQALADLAALRISDALHRRDLQTQLLENASQEPPLAADLNTALEKLADQLRQAGNASAALLYNREGENGGAAYVQASQDPSQELHPGNGAPPASHRSGPLFPELPPDPQPVIASLDDPALPDAQRAALQKAGVQSALLLPLQLDGQLVGAAELWTYHSDHEFSQDQIAACRKLTPLAALALESIRLYRQAQEQAGEQERFARAVQASEERYALAAQGSKDGLWDWNLESNTIYFSPRWTESIGFAEGAFGDQPDDWFNRIHPDDLERVKVEISLHLEGFSPHFESEYRLRHRDGTFRWMLARGLAVRDENRKAYRMAGSQTDITERKQAEDQLRRNAFFDSLTQLPNRDLFLDRLSHAIERARRRTDEFFAVLFLDLDHFKSVNDRLGHDVGDHLLAAVAGRLKNCVRAVDTVARLGGDEFIILLEDLESISNTTLVAQRILAELEQPFHLSGHEAYITASIGIAFSSAGYERYEDLLRDADTAMYQAKAAGKAQYAIFETKLGGRAAAFLNLEKDLRTGLARKEFCLHFQPIVSLDSGRVVGFEALLRWLHPDRGLLEPIDFLAAAEETGLIIPIGNWVIQEACRQMNAWRSKFPKDLPLVMSVNVSGEELAQPGFVTHIERALQEFNLAGEKLVIEVTAHGLAQAGDAGLENLARLQPSGVQVHLDDLSAPETTTPRLPDLPISTLKIDSGLVARLDEARQEVAPVRAIIELAQKLGMTVIAEGVETADQLTRLKQLECNAAQGYFFSPPVDGAAIS